MDSRQALGCFCGKKKWRQVWSAPTIVYDTKYRHIIFLFTEFIVPDPNTINFVGDCT